MAFGTLYNPIRGRAGFRVFNVGDIYLVWVLVRRDAERGEFKIGINR